MAIPIKYIDNTRDNYCINFTEELRETRRHMAGTVP